MMATLNKLLMFFKKEFALYTTRNGLAVSFGKTAENIKTLNTVFKRIHHSNIARINI
jgi:hypothetical protein